MCFSAGFELELGYKYTKLLIRHKRFSFLTPELKTKKVNSGLKLLFFLSALQYQYISDNNYCFLRILMSSFWINDSIIPQLVSEINVGIRLSNSLIAHLTSNSKLCV